MATAKQREVLSTDYHQEYGSLADSIQKKMNILLDLADSGEISPFELAANHRAMLWLDRTMGENMELYRHVIFQRRQKQKERRAQKSEELAKETAQAKA